MYESYNPYLNNQFMPQTSNRQLSSFYNAYNPVNYKPQNASFSLQGKVVDSLDVVKATDIPYDGTISYFPLTDGTAIITKQLQQDGTSKVTIYKPMIENEENKYITESDLKKQINDMNSKYITEDDLKEQIKNINSKDIKDMKEDIKTLKRKLEDTIDDFRDKKEK